MRNLAKKIIEALLTFALFSISAVLDVRLFAQLAGQDEPEAKAIFVAIALIFAGCKVFLWLWGFVHRSIVAIGVAGVLSLMSIFASFSSALAIMTTASLATESLVEVSEDLKGQIAVLEADIASLVEARNRLPEDYIAARGRYEKLIEPKQLELRELRASRSAAAADIRAESAATSVYYLFDSVGAFFSPQGGRELGSRIRFVFTLIVASLIEVIAVVMSWFETRSAVPDPSEGKVRFVLDAGTTHISTGTLSLCGRSSSQVLASKGDSRLCPGCSMKFALLRLQSK